MPTTRALVVDDSKTARVTLGRVLSGFDLQVDTADSAETALEYLKHTLPSVIFMDHMMPGMDGFEAVKLIKANPRTATIPIMMYTTKGGELYLGQARALGAIGVLPKEVKPADIETVLRGLNLLPAPATPKPAAKKDSAATPGDPELTLSAAAEQVQRYADDLVTLTQLRQMLDEQQRRLGEEIDTRVEQSLARFADQRRLTERRYLVAGLGVLAAMVLVIPLWTVRLTDSKPPTAGTPTEEPTVLAADGASAAPESAQREPSADTVSPAEATDGPLLETLSWALNDSMEFDYQEVPLDGARLDRLQELLARLNDLGVGGTIHLDVHNGSFCLRRDEFDNLTLADPAMPVAECDPIALTQDTIPTPEQSQSLAFANFLATSALIQNGSVRVQVNLVGRDEPRTDYPDPSASPTAGDWNAAARSNNRVEIRLAPPSG
ncbi:MAG: response regulator [Chromatiales bacterium]|jgi:CheY-like chemotaxis protein